ncbi:hypothetical protein BSM4216_3037 [Bacillus smithii]|nr:hypothetical protein BSM4216_3037 [Bacillus smithii]
MAHLRSFLFQLIHQLEQQTNPARFGARKHPHHGGYVKHEK